MSSHLIPFERISLTATNIEENVVTSYLVHDANCIVSMPEFALRLQISIDDKTTADIFRIFDTVCVDAFFSGNFIRNSKINFLFCLRLTEGLRHHWFSRVFTVCFILNQTKPSANRSDTHRIENVRRLRQRTEKSNQKSFIQCSESHDGSRRGWHHWNLFPNRYHTKRIHHNRYVVRWPTPQSLKKKTPIDDLLTLFIRRWTSVISSK